GIRGISSAGRAPQWHCGGLRFDPGMLHQEIEPGFREDPGSLVSGNEPPRNAIPSLCPSPGGECPPRGWCAFLVRNRPTHHVVERTSWNGNPCSLGTLLGAANLRRIFLRKALSRVR